MFAMARSMGCLAVLSVLVLLGVTACAAASAAPLMGGRAGGGDVAKTFPIGGWVIEWTNGTLSAASASNPGRKVWSSVPNGAFVSVAAVDFAATEWQGNFKVVDTVQWRSGAQTAVSIAVSGNTCAVTGTIDANGASLPFKLTFTALDSGHLQFAVSVSTTGADYGSSAAPNAVYLTYASQSDEAIVGMGASYTYTNLKGRVVPVLTSEQGVGRGLQPLTGILNLFRHGSGGNWHTTYSPIPHYMTSLNRSVFLENTQYSQFDFSADDSIDVQVVTGVVDTLTMTGRVLYGESPLQLVERYTNYSGRQPALPEWVGGGGAVVGMEGGTTVVRANVKQLQEAGVPVAGVWLQDWTGLRIDSFGKRLWWNWEVDEQYYYDWSGLMTEFYAAGIRVLTYINPNLANNVETKAHYRRNMFKEAAALGYLVKNSTGQPYIQASASAQFTFGSMDFTNPKARQWFADVMRCNMLYVGNSTCEAGAIPANATTGVWGWMSDFGEYLPFDATLYDGDAATVHNLYPQLWSQANRMAVEQAGMWGEVPYFSRSAAQKSPTYAPLMWMGDQLVTFDNYDGLLSAITGMMSYGFSGFSQAHSDTGGYTMIDEAGIIKYLRSKELLLRWMEMTAFSDCMFRTHPGNLPSKSWQYNSDNQTLMAFKTWASVHKALWPYRQGLVELAASVGIPTTRHPLLHYPTDPKVWELTAQFMLGDAMMVAPVGKAGATSVQVYLPVGSGTWRHVFSGDEFSTPGWITLPAPIGMPAVLLRTESPWAERLQGAICGAVPEGLCKA